MCSTALNNMLLHMGHEPEGFKNPDNSELIFGLRDCRNILEGKACECDPYWYAMEGCCVICNTLTKLRCNGCNLKPFYCSKECQTKGWETGHKSVCGFWKEVKVEGRTFYEAKKRIPAGTKLFRKAPLYVQPDKISHFQYCNLPQSMELIPTVVKLNPVVTCLSCHGFCGPMEPVDPRNIKYRRCSTCKWPVCNTAKCAEKHKEMPECSLFAKNRVTYEKILTTMAPYGLIGLIRAVCLKKFNPEKWEQLLRLETFKRPNDEQGEDLHVVQEMFRFLRQVLKMDWMSESEFQVFLSIQSQNRFRCNHRYTWDTRFATIIYEGPRGTILPHSCSPNAFVTVDKLNFIGTVITHVPIKKGDQLTICIDPEFPRIMKPLYTRNRYLTADGHQLCGKSGIYCDWCLNPKTEGGTMLSAIKCDKCDAGHLMPNDVKDNMWIYTCSTPGCSRVSNNNIIQEEEAMMFKMYTSFNGDITMMQKWLAETNKKSLHPFHYLSILARVFIAGKSGSMIMRAKLNTLQHLRKGKEFLPRFQFMLNWMNTFTPGRHYYIADFMFFEILLTLGSYAVDLHEKTKTLQEVDDLVEELLKKLEWCWEIYNEDPMRNLMDLNIHQKIEKKFVCQFFVTAEKIFDGEFKPLEEEEKVLLKKSRENKSKSFVVVEEEDLEAAAGSGDNIQVVPFPNLRSLAERKKLKTWTGCSHLGDHLAPPQDANHVEASFYVIDEAAQDINIFD